MAEEAGDNDVNDRLRTRLRGVKFVRICLLLIDS